MDRTRHHLWHYSETGKPAGESTDNLSWNANPYCPTCGQLTSWTTFQIGQDPIGNEIYGGNYACFKCAISTEVEEIDRSE